MIASGVAFCGKIALPLLYTCNVDNLARACKCAARGPHRRMRAHVRCDARENSRAHAGGALMHEFLSSGRGVTLAATLLLPAGVALLRLAWVRGSARGLVLAGWVLI